MTFSVSPQISDIILPISFGQTQAAVQMNLDTRRQAITYLNGGGAIGVFPGGTVSTSLRPFGLSADPGWRSFTAKLITKSNAKVVPIYFEGQNSRRFQILSRVHTNLRLGLLINEFYRRTDKPVKIRIGAPITVADLGAATRNGQVMMDELRTRTYALSGQMRDYGYEFEDIHRRDQKA